MISVNTKLCCYCGGCTSVCPVAALELKETRIVCSDKCINCGSCKKACPVGAIKLEGEQ